ncbi:ABC transporter ATP-binding protein [Candidatus Aerophobetes bacterium]|nr:ABC transporter ATP-binding protein [Candidatus Aerophobetes bacterium]
MSYLKVLRAKAGYGRKKVIEGLNFQAEKGKITLVVGPNGSGKSTLAMIIAGLLRLSEGSILLNGEDITHLVAEERARRGISLVPERRHLFSEMSVKENLLMGGIYLPTLQVEKEIKKVYRLFPVLKMRTHQIAGTLSGGEQQMLTIARALICNPEVLILDEPCRGISYKLIEKILRVLLYLKEKGTTIILIEQNAEVMEIADYAYAMQVGRVIARGKPQKVLSQKNIKTLFFE